jgi:hypothetical protein
MQSKAGLVFFTGDIIFYRGPCKHHQYVHHKVVKNVFQILFLILIIVLKLFPLYRSHISEEFLRSIFERCIELCYFDIQAPHNRSATWQCARAKRFYHS